MLMGHLQGQTQGQTQGRRVPRRLLTSPAIFLILRENLKWESVQGRDV